MYENISMAQQLPYDVGAAIEDLLHVVTAPSHGEDMHIMVLHDIALALFDDDAVCALRKIADAIDMAEDG